MSYKKIALSLLVINPANDRHGELENETAAIAHLFALQEQHMKNLAKDLVKKGEMFEPPLVFPDKDKFRVADGNRRTTCMKLLASPQRAPTVELQQFFADQRRNWTGIFPDKIQCQVEPDRDRVDDILFRRHTGVQGGIGQSTWTDRMKSNFVIRTGKGDTLNVADEIEKWLKNSRLLPAKKIPRSTLNRLLSAESLRQRVGISVQVGKLVMLRDEQATLNALVRISTDLATRKVTLEDVWDSEAKRHYIDLLESEGILPPVMPISKKPKVPSPTFPVVTLPSKPLAPPALPPKPAENINLIPKVQFNVGWTATLDRHREIWEELQFKLVLTEHPNAIAVLLRVLLELSIENYIARQKLAGIHPNDKLGLRASKVSKDMLSKGKIDNKYYGAIQKIQQSEEIVSTDTLNRYVHSPNFRVSPDHLRKLWGTLSEFIVLCLNA